MTWIVKTTKKAIDITIVRPRARPDDRGDDDNDRGGVEHPADALCASKLSAPNTPTPARKNCTTAPAAMSSATQW